MIGLPERLASDNIADVITPDVMTVRGSDGDLAQWSLKCSAQAASHGHEVVLIEPDGTEWHGQAADVFECVVELRLRLEPLGFRLCCNASRRDAWASGMQRDMGSGFAVYLLAGVPPGTRPPQVPTLDYAPPDETVGYEEQRAWYQDWLAKPRE